MTLKHCSSSVRVALWSKALACGAKVAGSNTAGYIDFHFEFFTCSKFHRDGNKHDVNSK